MQLLRHKPLIGYLVVLGLLAVLAVAASTAVVAPQTQASQGAITDTDRRNVLALRTRNAELLAHSHSATALGSWAHKTIGFSREALRARERQGAGDRDPLIDAWKQVISDARALREAELPATRHAHIRRLLSTGDRMTSLVMPAGVHIPDPVPAEPAASPHTTPAATPPTAGPQPRPTPPPTPPMPRRSAPADPTPPPPTRTP